jgi:hypothetical protein
VPRQNLLKFSNRFWREPNRLAFLACNLSLFRTVRINLQVRRTITILNDRVCAFRFAVPRLNRQVLMLKVSDNRHSSSMRRHTHAMNSRSFDTAIGRVSREQSSQQSRSETKGGRHNQASSVETRPNRCDQEGLRGRALLSA